MFLIKQNRFSTLLLNHWYLLNIIKNKKQVSHFINATICTLLSQVIITSVTTAKDALPPPQHPPTHYRFGQYSPAHHGYTYAYPHQYYPSPHTAAYAHHDLCYSPNPYLHPKYVPPPHTAYRRYLPNVQYYPHGTPDLYNTAAIANQQSQQVSSINFMYYLKTNI